MDLNYFYFRSFLFIITLIALGTSTTSLENNSNVDEKNDWDVLIFTQQWPQTVCYRWMEEDKTNRCLLPSTKNIWTIHGIWPTKYGELGPNFCNTTWPFNFTQIEPIENQLEQFWTNVEKGTQLDALWRHEWDKHGTCAAVINELNTENKYFGQGLIWYQQYEMSTILTKSGILPDSQYTVENFYNIVKQHLHKNPVIRCIYDHKTKQNFLSEIRICFNKNLELSDCDGVLLNGINNFIEHLDDKIITNCGQNKPIMYPSLVPTKNLNEIEETYSWEFPFVNFYKLIQLLKLITL